MPLLTKGFRIEARDKTEGLSFAGVCSLGACDWCFAPGILDVTWSVVAHLSEPSVLLAQSLPVTGTSRSACLLPALPLCLPPASPQCARACGWLPEQPHQPTGCDKSLQGLAEDNCTSKAWRAGVRQASLYDIYQLPSWIPPKNEQHRCCCSESEPGRNRTADTPGKHLNNSVCYLIILIHRKVVLGVKGDTWM